MEKVLEISSPSFADNGFIPSKFTCDGADVNPALKIAGLPSETKSLALIVDDPDAPGRTWVHWLVWNIPPTDVLPENSVPGVEGLNDFRRRGYGGPCPPSGTHRYFFKAYALDRILSLEAGAGKEALEQAMRGHICGNGVLIGRYARSR